MKTARQVCGEIEMLELPMLQGWVESGWIEIEWQGADTPSFTEIDEARVRFIVELRNDMAVEEDTVPLVLNLLDQIYDLQSQLEKIGDAIRRQPEAVQRDIFEALDKDG